MAGGFEEASKSVLAYLHGRLGMGLWMVTRVSGEDWIVLTSEDHGYSIGPGAVFPWADSFCSQMVQDLGPRIAPRSDDVAAYRDAPIAGYTPIGAYVGVPLKDLDGRLFGTLCAIDPAPQPEALNDSLLLVELLGGLLSGILSLELRAADAERSSTVARREAMLDPLTHLFNRRGWDVLLDEEEARCRRYGHPAAVILIDLNGFKQTNDEHGHAMGDALLKKCGLAISSAVRDHDVAARIGGDEFAVLAIEATEPGAVAIVERIEAAFASMGIDAAVGFARRDHSRGLAHAMDEADARMYEAKKATRALRT